MASRAWLAAALVLCALASSAFVPGAAARQSEGAREDAGFVSFALARGGTVEIDNRRGGVRVEVTGGEQVELSAVEQGAAANAPAKVARGRGAARTKSRAPQRRLMPVSVQRVGDSLKIAVTRAATAAAPRVDLTVRVPAYASLQVATSDGPLDVAGLPAALSAQTISGDLTLSLPVPPDADLTAQSLNGSVSVAGGVDAAGARAVRGKFQTRLGSGSARVNLFSGRGRISLEVFDGEANARVRTSGENQTSLGRGGAGDAPPRVKETPDSAPFKPALQKPEPAETPQEVDDDEVVRVESDLVTVNVSVVDRASGRGMAGLTASDFHVYEDNVEQRVEHFESAEGPFDLLLLLDLSGSTARVTDTIRAAARRFVESTRARDRVAVVAFAGDAQLVSPLTADRAALYSAIGRVARPEGDTRLYDAVGYALEYMTRTQDPARRRAVIVLSDGLDSTLPNVTGRGSALAYEELRSRAQEFDGILYAVWTDTEFYEAFSPEDIQPETYDLAHDRMKELADAGGGAFYEVERLEDLAGAYERVVADLGTVYSLSYRPTNKRRDGLWRAIRVRLPRLPAAVARGRRGYLAN
ncbi:MAG TPA: VWA domain-containing protein [Pyrinomonadaceae bacterium]|nr:VWA domain-containing protein [Pyrinomonadaceae bacterium]